MHLQGDFTQITTPSTSNVLDEAFHQLVSPEGVEDTKPYGLSFRVHDQFDFRMLDTNSYLNSYIIEGSYALLSQMIARLEKWYDEGGLYHVYVDVTDYSGESRVDWKPISRFVSFISADMAKLDRFASKFPRLNCVLKEVMEVELDASSQDLDICQ